MDRHRGRKQKQPRSSQQNAETQLHRQAIDKPTTGKQQSKAHEKINTRSAKRERIHNNNAQPPP